MTVRQQIVDVLKAIGYQLINGEGRRLAWAIYAQSIAGHGIPSYNQLRWNTRSYEVDDVDHFESRPSVSQPVVAGDLLRFTVRRWFGPPLIFYTVHACMNLQVMGEQAAYERSQAFVTLEAARAHLSRNWNSLRLVQWTPATSPAPVATVTQPD